MSTASRTAGSKPVTTPRMTGGMSKINFKNGTAGIILVAESEGCLEKLTFCEVVDVADSTNNSHRNSPEDNQ